MNRHRPSLAKLAVIIAGALGGVLPSPALARTNLSVTPGPDGRDVVALAQQDLHRVDLLSVGDREAKVIRRLGRRGSKPGEFLLPEGAVVDRDGSVWVSDTGNDRIQRFDRHGAVNLVVTRAGRFGRLSRPGGIALAPNGRRLYVAETGHDRVLVLDLHGRALDAWGGSGQASGRLLLPHGVAVSPDEDSVYVIDLISPRIQVFTPDGRFVRCTSSAPGLGGIVNATAISVGPDGSVYLTDETLGRVTRFTRDLQVVHALGGAHGSGPGSFYNPQGVAIDGLGRLWVVDYGNHRGQVFSDSGDFRFMFEEGAIGVIERSGPRPLGGRSRLLVPLLMVVLVIGLARRATVPGSAAEAPTV